jgi:hypothetical protein
MLRAVGLTDDDWGKPQIGVASSWNEITPCNASLRRLTAAAKEGVRRAGGVPLEFGTITVSDGISMGNEGMRASLVSREIIADSVEAVMHAERFDGLVATGGCDKSMPGMMMAIARLNLPGVFVYNGSTLPGYLNGKALDITSVFEAIGACAAGTITEGELHAIEKNACPGEGACGGMFTANTMSSIGEAIGMSIPGIDLSRPARPTKPSKRSACITVSTESTITSRDTSEARMPSWPIEMPSLTVIVPNSRGKPPASRTPTLACSASLRSVMLQGVTSFHDEAMPICGFTQSASPMPTARSIARDGAFCMPSVTSRERGLMSTGVSFVREASLMACTVVVRADSHPGAPPTPLRVTTRVRPAM